MTGICTVTLGAAPSVDTIVAIKSDHTELTVPDTVTIPVGALSADFSAIAAQVATDTRVTVTATLDGSSKSYAVMLHSPPVLSSVTCNQTSLAANASTTCYVNLNKAAFADTPVSVVSSDPDVLAISAPTVTVLDGKSNAAFTIQAGLVEFTQLATVNATLNGVTKSRVITVQTPVPASLRCDSTIPSEGGGNCTVTLSAAPAADLAVALKVDNAILSVPASVTVSASATTATFAVIAGAVTVDTRSTVTASAGGSSKSYTLTITSPPVLSSITCNQTSLAANASTTCYANLNKAASAATTVTIASGDPSILAVSASSVTVLPGKTNASFTITAAASSVSQLVVISGTLNGITKTRSITVQAPSPTSLRCDVSSLPGGSTTACTVTLTSAPPSELTVTLKSDNAALSMPASVAVPAGTTIASFTATAGTVSADTVARITATANGTSKTYAITVQSPPVISSSLSCNRTSLTVGGVVATCTVYPNKRWSSPLIITLSNNNPSAVSLSASSITVAANATAASFTATAVSVGSATITATLNGSTKSVTLQVN